MSSIAKLNSFNHGHFYLFILQWKIGKKLNTLTFNFLIIKENQNNFSCTLLGLNVKKKSFILQTVYYTN